MEKNTPETVTEPAAGGAKPPPHPPPPATAQSGQGSPKEPQPPLKSVAVAAETVAEMKGSGKGSFGRMDRLLSITAAAAGLFLLTLVIFQSISAHPNKDY